MQDLFADTEPIRVAVLGSTGSVGTQALEVIRSHPDRFELVALCAGSDASTLQQQAKEFGVPLVGIANGTLGDASGVTVIDGPDAAAQIVEACDAQVVLNAVVGSAGLQATMATILSGKTLALANKESLVAAGELVMGKASPGQLRPVDSEHSAMWQLLENSPAELVRRIFVTGSGGPFRGMTRSQMEDVSVEEALAHPVWNMGPKITIDSATMMNKGLEVIEAHFLFGFTYDEIEVVVHPQSKIHAMSEMTDGSVFMYAAQPDMRLPIQIALLWPDRIGAPGERLGWSVDQEFTFEPPDMEAFPCLRLAYEAGRKGDTYPAALNAANEVAVAAFIEGRIKFGQIATVAEGVLEAHEPCPPSLEGVMEVDSWARLQAEEAISR